MESPPFERSERALEKSSSPPSTASSLPSEVRDRGPTTHKDVDQAFVFLDLAHHNHAGAETPYSDALRRRVDWRIVPIMFACYTMQYLDKVLLNVSLLPSLLRLDSCSLSTVCLGHGPEQRSQTCRQRLQQYRLCILHRLLDRRIAQR